MALAALEVARELGLSVPDDLSLISFDDTPIVRFARPPLTAVDQPIAATASRAVELIIDAQRGRPACPTSRWWCRRRWSPAIDRVAPASRRREWRPRRRTPAVALPVAVRARLGRGRRCLRSVPDDPAAAARRRHRRRPDSVRVLGLITFFGAVAASVGNILFGWLSDRDAEPRGRGSPPACSISLDLADLGPARQRPGGRSSLLVVCWQLALNMMLGPLSAWAADHVPRDRTGLLGGLMALSPALGALVRGHRDRSRASPMPTSGCGWSRRWSRPASPRRSYSVRKRPRARRARAIRRRASAAARFALTMWLARLLGADRRSGAVRLSPALFPVARSADRARARSRGCSARCWRPRCRSRSLSGAGPTAARGRPGRWRSAPCCSALGAAGACRSASNVGQAIAAYVLFGLATTVFLSLHSGQTLRVLPSPAHRGRDLGCSTSPTPCLR